MAIYPQPRSTFTNDLHVKLNIKNAKFYEVSMNFYFDEVKKVIVLLEQQGIEFDNIKRADIHEFIQKYDTPLCDHMQILLPYQVGLACDQILVALDSAQQLIRSHPNNQLYGDKLLSEQLLLYLLKQLCPQSEQSSIDAICDDLVRNIVTQVRRDFCCEQMHSRVPEIGDSACSPKKLHEFLTQNNSHYAQFPLYFVRQLLKLQPSLGSGEVPKRLPTAQAPKLARTPRRQLRPVPKPELSDITIKVVNPPIVKKAKSQQVQRLRVVSPVQSIRPWTPPKYSVASKPHSEQIRNRINEMRTGSQRVAERPIAGEKFNFRVSEFRRNVMKSQQQIQKVLRKWIPAQ